MASGDDATAEDINQKDCGQCQDLLPGGDDPLHVDDTADDNCSSASSAALPGGFQEGDSVVSLTTFSSKMGQVAQGDIGLVRGKSSNPSAPMAELKVCCSFPGMEEVNILSADIRRLGAVVAGGFRVGDEVVALAEYTGKSGSVAKGDIGTVLSACNDPSIPGADNRICCKFPNIDEYNIPQKQIWRRGLPLVGGLHIGDEVVILQDYSGMFGFVPGGTVGIVRGPNDNPDLDDAQMRLNVDFETHAGTNLLFGTEIWKVGSCVANGLVIGDEVVALVAYEDSEGYVSRGHSGFVRGPGANIALPDDDDDDEGSMVCSVLCSFPNHPSVDLDQKDIWKRSKAVVRDLCVGDEVVLLSTIEGEPAVPLGSTGRIFGPGSTAVLDSGKYAACFFDDLACDRDVPASELWRRGEPLPGGLQVGDRVACLVNHKSVKGAVCRGAPGIVLGPSRDRHAGDSQMRVNCKFPEHQSVNMLYSAVWKLSEALPGGFHIGDKVVALTAYEGSEGRFARDEVGTVAGPSTKPSAADASERVNCTFPEHRNANLHFRTIWTRGAPLNSSGFHIGDEVVALADYRGSQGRVAKADRGVVLGPSTKPSAPDADRKVNCSFPGHGNVNMLASKLWSSQAPLAGGYLVHEQVVCLVDYAGTDGRVARGDLGTVLGPCAPAQAADAERRVNVAFESHSNANPFHTAIVRKKDVPEDGLPLEEVVDSNG